MDLSHESYLDEVDQCCCLIWLPEVVEWSMRNPDINPLTAARPVLSCGAASQGSLGNQAKKLEKTGSNVYSFK